MIKLEYMNNNIRRLKLMIRKLENNDVDRVMHIWLKSTVKAHDFIEKSIGKITIIQ